MPNPILRFARMPAVSNRPQRALNGKEYKISSITMPFAWAVEVGAKDGVLYRLMIDGGTQARPRQQEKPQEHPRPSPRRAVHDRLLCALQRSGSSPE